MTYVYKPDQHECKPPTIGGFGRFADAPVGSIWRCDCRSYFVVEWVYWNRVGFWNFAAKKRIKEYERLHEKEWGMTK